MTQDGTLVKWLAPTLPHGNAPMRVKPDLQTVAKAILPALFLTFASATALLAEDKVSAPKGQLVIVGGGKFEIPLRRRTLDLAGGPKAHVVLIPNASRDKSAWPIMIDRWRSRRGQGRRHYRLDRSQKSGRDGPIRRPHLDSRRQSKPLHGFAQRHRRDRGDSGAVSARRRRRRDSAARRSCPT